MGGSTPNPKRQHEPWFKDGIFRDPKVAAAEDNGRMESSVQALSLAMQKIGEAVYGAQSAAGEGAAGGGESEPGSAPQGEGTVEGEFREV